MTASTTGLEGLRSYVDGDHLGGGDPLRVTDPATLSTVAEVPTAGVADFERAVLAARRAFDRGDWPGIPAAERAAVVLRFVAALEARREHLGETVVAETGALVASARGVQVDGALGQARDAVRIHASLPEEEHNPVPLDALVTGGRVATSVLTWEPLGVVSAIPAYNVPLFLALWKVVPALLAGNTVVLRPSPLAPLTVLALGAAAKEAGLPPGVLNVLVEQGDAGARLMTTDPRVDAVSFTGSTSVGSAIMAQAAPTLKRVLLELGGKSAGIYLPGAVDRAADGIATVMRAMAGQGCVLQTRVLVPQARKDEVLAQAAERVAALRLGDPRDPETDVGPVISAAQVTRCADHVAAARRHGGRVVTGGRPRPELGGHFFEPTVVDLPDTANPLAQEETFGPVVSVLGYRDVDHAVELANDTVYGLSGGVFGPTEEALAVARRIRAGTVLVNGGYFGAFASSGGWRRSGEWRERGREGIRAYQQAKHLTAVSH
ncbi:aldehyde dehydrogenase [Prauserella sp. PE36]|uniref:aldehyde dehydrogenase family protein n=1 Tax=Prauserella sp. PE36 TaxID=1504709 RepID=UPI000D8B7D23|nr:aldehyde dehydrogenase family protein [Prauserella sp. PE36]PXY33249.1 aldehyde dehydrogenase [Prauserella coralliicola]RBM16198.1 aldehyde dehydrogenase [Prauserella sp. PE36]